MNRPYSSHLPRAALHAALSPIVAIALLAVAVSLLSAGAMTALGVPMSVAWLAPSLEWTLRHQPTWVLGWTAWLAVPSVLTVALVAVVFRRVVGVRWWAWALVGAAAWTAFAALRAYGLGDVLAPMPEPYRVPMIVGGAVGGLLVAPLTAGLVRLLAAALGRLHRPRNGEAQGTLPEPERGTKVSVRAS